MVIGYDELKRKIRLLHQNGADGFFNGFFFVVIRHQTNQGNALKLLVNGFYRGGGEVDDIKNSFFKQRKTSAR